MTVQSFVKPVFVEAVHFPHPAADGIALVGTPVLFFGNYKYDPRRETALVNTVLKNHLNGKMAFGFSS